MGYPIRQSQTAQPLVFLLVSSSDHITGLTGATPAVKISKNGAAGVSPSGAVSEIDATNLPGWYKVAGNATDTGTLGPLLLHATATGADPTDDRFDVVAYDPQDTVRLGLTSIPNAASGSAGALLVDGTGTAAISNSGGKVLLQATQTGVTIPNVTTTTTATTVTNPVTVGTNNDKLNYSLASPPPTAVQIRTELDTNSSKLSNLDATISSRMATFTLPANFSALAITASTGKVTVGTNSDKAGYSIAGTKTTLDALHDFNPASDIVAHVTLVDTCTTNTDMRGTDNAYTGTPPTSSVIAAAVWDLTTTGHTTSGTFGAAMNAAGAAGDPWSTSVPGAYGTGTAGYILGTNLDATVSSRAVPGSAMTVSDKTGFSLTTAYDPAKTAAQPGDTMVVDLTTAVPTSNTANTMGDCLNAARADGFGKWVKNGTALTLYAPDGTTAVRVFTLDDSTNPSTRS